MNASYDDPKYTAYVLGELDASERETVEAELRDDPQLAAAVAEIRVATERLTQALHSEHLPRLHEGQRAVLLATAGALVDGREQLNGTPSPDSPSLHSPSPWPSPVKGEGENLEKVGVASVPTRPRRLSWRGRLVAIGTLAVAGGLLVAVVLPSLRDSREKELALRKEQLIFTSSEGISDPSSNFSSLEEARTIEGFDSTLSLTVEGESVNAPAGGYFNKSEAGAKYHPNNNLYADPQSGVRYADGKRIYEPRNRSVDASSPAGTKPVDLPTAAVPQKPSPNSTSATTASPERIDRDGDEFGARGRQTATGRGLALDSNNGQPSPGQDFGVLKGKGYGRRPEREKDLQSDKQSGNQGNQPSGNQQQQAGQQPGDQSKLGSTLQQTDHLSSLERKENKKRDKSEAAREPTGGEVFGRADVASRGGKVKELEEGEAIREGRQWQEGLGGGGGISVGKHWNFEGFHNTEAYDYVNDNPFLGSGENPLSTFSIDVDTASYSNIRRFLMQQNQRPPRGAVRIEELVNYFRYDYPQPEGDKPFSVTTEVASCPWEPEHRLVRIGLKGRELAKDKRPPSNLVFLIDVSGSMQPENKLPLVKQSLKMLAEQLGENDKVSMVVYAGNSGLVLPSTRGDHREAIWNAINQLDAGGSTNGAQGIELAYEIATNNLQKGGVNRVILATDGDFNVGVTNQDDLVRLIEEKAKTGVFLTTLGFGMGNIKDSTLEKLADKGNGNYAYIDDLPEARKVLVEEIGSTLVTIAKDVKIQVEFNPAEVAGYRLIGYENRIMAKEDFNDDKKDAGEIGAGHTVTALYEVVPVAKADEKAEGRKQKAEGKESGDKSQESDVAGKDAVTKEDSLAAASKPEAAGASTVDALRYQKPASLSDAAKTGELFTLKLRYKQPDGDKSTLMETQVKDAGKKYREASADFKFAAAVASFGMILRDSPFKGSATIAAAEELAGEGVAKKDDKQQTDVSYRAEFVEMVKKAKMLGAP